MHYNSQALPSGSRLDQKRAEVHLWLAFPASGITGSQKRADVAPSAPRLVDQP